MSKPLRLLVIVNHFLPDRGGGGAVYSDMCFALARRGVEVTAWAPYPFYPEWKDKSGRNGWRFWRYREQGVDVVRYGFAIPRNPRSLWQRMLFEATLLLSLLRLVPRARKFDAVMVYCPYFSAVVAAAVVRLLFRMPVWLNVQDFAADAAKATGMVRSGIVARTFAGVERFFYNRADVWSSISPVMIRKLQPLRRRGQPIVFLPNWTDADLLAEIRRQPMRAPENVPVRLLYAGNIGGKQNLIGFCRFMHATTADFAFRIFGDGGAASEVEAFVRSAADPRFSFGPFLDARSLAAEMGAADFYVITEQSGAGNSFFPSKLVSGMAAGLPILAVSDGESPLGVEMREANPGPQVRWDEIDQVPALLARIAADPSPLRQWRANALRRAATYDRDAIVDRLKANLDRFAKERAVETRAALGEVPAGRDIRLRAPAG